jgi:hypothetical protein
MLKKLLSLIFKRNNKTTSEVPVDEENRSSENLKEVESHSAPKVSFSQPESTVSRRVQDMSAESELAEFLDEFLYAPLLREGNFISIQRMVEKEQQLQGIDVVVKTNKSVGYIDEKAQLYYINKNIPTFAFELQFLKMGREIEGWFLNDNLKTDYYLLIWPSASIDDVKRLKKEDFTKLDALMISKKKLRDELTSLGLDKETLTKRIYEIRKSRTYGKITTGIQGIYYYASDPLKYVEAPINIVISKTRLTSLSDVHYEITTGGFKRI